ncbi:MAG: DUF3024 domain-containing protein [Elusimicrobiota bacterium]
MLAETEKTLLNESLNHYCETRIPSHIRDKVRLIHRWRGNTVTLIETRPYFQDPKRWTESPVAQFRYVAARKRWALYCRDGKGRWYLYDEVKPAISIQTLLDEVDRDPTGIFWG